MIRKMLESKGFKMTDEEFENVMQAATDDVRENRIKFGKRTSLEQMLTIALRTYLVIQRVA